MQEINPSGQKYTVVIKAVVLVVTCLCVGLLTGGIYMAYKRPQTKFFSKRTLYNLCNSEQCLEQASRILTNMDISVDPCVDFYHFTCGNFMRHGEIPKDQTRLLLALENKKLVEEGLMAAYKADSERFVQPIRNLKQFFQQCTHSELYSSASYKSLKAILFGLKWPVLIKNWNEQFAASFNWLECETRLQIMGLTSVFLNIDIKYDQRNYSVTYIGLDCTAPTLSKEILKSSKLKEVLEEYESVIDQFFKIMGGDYDHNVSKEILDFILKVETIKPSSYEMSDANFFNVFRHTTVVALKEELKIDLLKYLRKVLPSSFMVTYNTYLGTNSYQCLVEMTSMLREADKRLIANYMMWMVVQNFLWILSNDTRQLDFRLNHAESGVQAPLPLYKLCVNFVDEVIPELSSALYIQMHYSVEKKRNLTTMVNLFIEELHQLVDEITWMDKQTK